MRPQSSHIFVNTTALRDIVDITGLVQNEINRAIVLLDFDNRPRKRRIEVLVFE